MNNTLYNNTSKDKLAKLLAMEDIHVRHSAEASTASFDVKHRVLTLPVWANLSAAVVDMMTGHEVGHALWTPLDGWKEALDEMIHKGILNIVEDARIEKKIKRKYPGIVKPFLDGYKDLYSKGFFGNTPPNELTFIDRINLFYKLGSLSGIFFTKEEEPYVKLVGDCETWDDVVECAKILQIKYTEDVVTADLREFNVIPSGGTGSAFDNPDGFDEDREEEEDGTGRDFKELQNKEEEAEEESEKSETSSGGNGYSSMPSAEDFDGGAGGRNELDSDFEDFETEATWERRKEELAEDKGRANYQYFGLPTPVLSKIVVNHKEIIKVFDGEMDTVWDRQMHQDDPHAAMRREMFKVAVDAQFIKFRNDSVKIVNYMAKEFERKKAADELRRVTISKTGILDMNKIHQYKFNDDIFLKKSYMPDGKNHGMIMLVDWSASMTHILLDTIKQVLNLVWFCQKVNIPFEVYAFTNAYREDHPDEDSLNYREELERFYSRKGKWNAKMGEVNDFQDDMNLLNFLSSRMSGRDLTKMAKYLYRYANSVSGYSRDVQDFGYYMHERWYRLGMGSTPTVDAMMAMQAIVPKFKSNNNLDKVNLICLTDGEPNSKFERCEDPTGTGYGKHLSFRLADHLIFDDPMSRRKYDVVQIMNRDKGTGCYRNVYQAQVIFLCDLLRDRFGVNCIGMFLNGDKTVRAKELEKYFGWRRFNPESHMKARQQLRKDGFVTINNSGWDEYYILPTGKMKIKDDGDFTVDPNATAGKIKTAFTKSLNKKFGSRVLVDRLMTWIA